MFLRRILSLFLLLSTPTVFIQIASAQTQLPAPRYSENLVGDSSFENGAKAWAIKNGTARVVDDVARSGRHSLLYDNNDPQRYELFTQDIAVSPGQSLIFSVWVKTENLVAPGAIPGAGIYLQSYVDGRYAGGQFTTGVSGTGDWREVSAVYTVPPEAERVSLGLRFLKGSVGKAWFDDVQVRVEIPSLLQSFLVNPAYRGMVKIGDNSPWKILTRVQPEDQNTQLFSAHATLRNVQGEVLREQKFSLPAQRGDQTLSFAPPTLAIGNYKFKLEYRLADGSVYLAREYQIQVVPELPQTRIDGDGFTLKNGERIFPLGLYLGPTEDEHLARIAAGGFNTILSYSFGQSKEPAAFLDRAAKHDLNVIFSVKDFYAGLKFAPKDGEPLARATELVELLKNHPALLAWYTNDELNPEWIPKIETMQRMIAQHDPNHPTFQVLYQVGQLEKYFDAADIIATDPYPIGKSDLTLTSTHTRRTVEAAAGARAPWIVPQIMDWAVYTPGRAPRPPTRDEMRNQAYQAIIGGAKGLIFYAYQDLFQEKYPRGALNQAAFDRRWPDVAAMAQEIKGVAPAVLHGKTVALNIPAKSKVKVRAIETENELLLLLANPYYEGNSITLEIPAGWKPAEAVQGQIGSTPGAAQMTFIVASIGSGVFRFIKN